MSNFRQCSYCDEPIAEGDPFELVNDGAVWLHRECMIRLALGSLGHRLRLCSCYGGTEGDPPGLTRRQAAKASASAQRFQAKGS